MPQIPFAFQCSIDKNQLLPLKDSVNGFLCSDRVTNIPEFEYYLKILPNGANDQRRGETWIFLRLEFKNVKKVEAHYTFTIESSNFSHKLHYIYEESEGWGTLICSTDEFFEPEKKFIVDGKFTVKVDGIFKYETEDEDADPTKFPYFFIQFIRKIVVNKCLQQVMPEIPFAFQCSIAENQLLPLKDSVDGFLCSDRVTNIPEFEYYLEIYPNGNNVEHRGQTWIFLQLNLNNVKKVEADFIFTIESANFYHKLHFIYEISYGWGSRICTTEKFFDPEKKYIADGKFTVKVNGLFKFENTIPAAVGDGQQKWIGGELGDESWAKDDTKDFTIVTADGKEIKVHKFVLSVRSEVFSAMFKSNMKEATENKVNITDFSYNVVEAALKLIYNCNFDSALSMEELMELLQFFDKYQLLSLKAKIEPYLIAQISASTVVRLTNNSIQTNSLKLKEKCMAFLSAAFASKTPLSDFKTLDKEIAFEVLENSFYKVLEVKK